MAKNKIRIIKQKFREIKKPSLIEIKQEKQLEKEVVEEEPEDFEFTEEGFGGERKAPVLELSKPREELEGMLEGVATGVERKEGKEEGGEEFKYDFEKPKYSFSEREIGEAGEMEELRHVVLEETPTLIERTPEAREVHDARIQDSMLENLGVEEYAVKYVKPHKQELLEESEEVKGKKIDIKKYRKER